MPLKFIIFAGPRTGSTSLTYVLSKSPDVKGIAMEPFNPRYPEWGEKDYEKSIVDSETLDRALQELSEKYDAIKHLYVQLKPELNFALLSRKDTKYLFLRRINTARQVLSQIIAEQTDFWNRWDIGFDEKVYDNLKPIDIEFMASLIELWEEKNRIFSQFLEENQKGNYLPLFYENLFSENLEKNIRTIQSICDFLGTALPPEKEIAWYMNPSTGKVNYRDLYKKVPNYQEIEARFGKIF